MPPDPTALCLGFIHYGTDAMQAGDFEKAGMLFRVAEKQAGALPPVQVSDYALLVECHLCLLQYSLGHTEEAKSAQAAAMALLDQNAASFESFAHADLMANVLMRLREYRRAIPFCERAILTELEAKNPTSVAGMLVRAAECYGLMGLTDHSAVSARAALKILRNFPGDPRLPSVLTTLGNALRKGSPQEAESLYRESAELHEAKAHLVSATKAWNNLGVLCSQQGRHAESLEFYKKTLQVREHFPSTKSAHMGRLLNNMALCYSRMGDFSEAHKLLDRAIELLQLDNEEGAFDLPSVYGSRGLILRDEGRDGEAVLMFQRSYAERKKTPSPDFESITANLNEEIAALQRLGRGEEALQASERLALVDAERIEFSHVDRNLSSLIARARGAVLVEVAYGNRHDNRYSKQELDQLAHDLDEAVSSQKAGLSGGWVTIPESTTFIFYSDDAPSLFRAMKPVLMNKPICEGATVTIRQDKKIRRKTLPSGRLR
jgi:tetratricopeptide (TPR) repeat protein